MSDTTLLTQLLREALEHFSRNHSLVDVRDWMKAATQALDEPTLVYVLFHETNSGHGDESDGWVEGIYATEADAERAKLEAIRKAVANGDDVYWNPDIEEEGPSDWTDDWRVEAHQIHESFTPDLTVAVVAELGKLGIPATYEYPGFILIPAFTPDRTKYDDISYAVGDVNDVWSGDRVKDDGEVMGEGFRLDEFRSKDPTIDPAKLAARIAEAVRS